MMESPRWWLTQREDGLPMIHAWSAVPITHRSLHFSSSSGCCAQGPPVPEGEMWKMIPGEAELQMGSFNQEPFRFPQAFPLAPGDGANTLALSRSPLCWDFSSGQLPCPQCGSLGCGQPLRPAPSASNQCLLEMQGPGPPPSPVNPNLHCHEVSRGFGGARSCLRSPMGATHY